MASTDALPIPRKNTAYRVTFPLMDADGDLVTGATGLDSEVSKDAGTFADCTNEATEIATSSGMYYLDLTSTEMNADCVAIIVKTSSSGAKTTPIVLYPEEAGDIRVNATQLNGTSLTGRDIGASVLLSSGTGTGQLDFTSGVVKANLAQILGTALTETAGLIAAGFKQFFNIASPTSTMNTITTVTTATNLTNAPTSGDLTATMKTSVTTAASAATPAVTVSDKTGFSLSTAGILAIWHQLTSAIVTASTIGKLLVDNVNATMSSRASQTSVDTIDDFVDTEVSAIKTQTDKLTFTVANQVDVNVLDWKSATAPAMTGDAFARLGAPVGASISADVAGVKTDTTSILSKLLKYVQLIVRKDSAIATDNATEVTAINANGGSGGGAYANTTDSHEALRDRGDAAWATATGFSTLDAAGVRTAVGLATANLDTQLDALPTAAENTTAVWAAGTRVLTAGTNIALAKGTGVTGFNDLSAAQVNAEADAALSDIRLHELMTTALTGQPAAGSLFGDLTDDDGAGTQQLNAQALELAPSGGGGLTVTDIVNGVWDEPAGDHVVSGSTGEALGAAGGAGDPWITSLPGSYSAGQAGYIVGTNLNTTVGSRSTLDGAGVQSALTSQGYTSTRAGYLDTLNGLVAAVWASATRLLTAGTNIVLAKGTGITGFNDLSAAQVNAEADAALSDVGLTTTITGRIDVASSTRASQTSVDTIDDLLDTEVAAIYNRIGAPAGASVSADIAAVKSQTAAIEIDTGTDIPATLATLAGYVDTEVSAIKAKTDGLPTIPASQGDVTTVGAAVAALNNVSTAQVKAQVVAALSTDTYTEPTSVPAATATLAAKIGWLMALWRNKMTQTGTTSTLRNDADTSSIATSTVGDDGTTYTQGEWQ